MSSSYYHSVFASIVFSVLSCSPSERPLLPQERDILVRAAITALNVQDTSSISLLLHHDTVTVCDEIREGQESLKETAMPAISRMVFVLLSPNEIRKRADQGAIFHFLWLSRIKFTGPEASVTLHVVQAVGSKPQIIHPYGFEFKFKKTVGVWQYFSKSIILS